MAWQDNFSSMFTDTLTIDEKKEWRFTLEEHKNKGTLHMNVRIFQTTGEYQGPTKSGFNLQVNSVEQVEELQAAFNAYFEKVKGMLAD